MVWQKSGKAEGKGMKTIRCTLKLTVILAVYVAILAVIYIPYAWIVPAIVLAGMLGKTTYQYTAYGTGRWAILADVRHMLEGPGLIIGHIAGKASRMEGLRALFNKGLPAGQAVRQFLETCQGVGPQNGESRQADRCGACHSCRSDGRREKRPCITPFLLTCRESCICIDPKGEQKFQPDFGRAEAHGSSDSQARPVCCLRGGW